MQQSIQIPWAAIGSWSATLIGMEVTSLLRPPQHCMIVSLHAQTMSTASVQSSPQEVSIVTRPPSPRNQSFLLLTSGPDRCYLKWRLNQVSSFPGGSFARRQGVHTGISCPYDNNSIYRSPGSHSDYTIECNLDRPGADLTQVAASSMEECISDCDSIAACVDVVWDGTTCKLKNAVVQSVPADGMTGAVLQTG
ncbi:hypothetical protein K431DRAFT_151462 [Polychaeton citri CBS 116435]|uniref:Apple domain-containing protein n=1 Tax=Polychaeton citri CBS 116435 TaxID=1314669 RepID=A0A9P4Q3X7_9PEZI|nr:hypothetical protein K431DRAFT_151462 [Polychaeton citri CBS 116435]